MKEQCTNLENTKCIIYYPTLDIVKSIASILIVGSHALPMFHNKIYNFYYGQWFFRWCVPFFFLSTGFFFYNMSYDRRKDYIKRLIMLYGISLIIYSPFIVRDTLKTSKGEGIIAGIKVFGTDVLLGYRHLWYLSASIIALFLIVVFLSSNRRIQEISSIRNVLIFMLFLIILGVVFDKYYLILNNDYVSKIANIINFVGGGRHALFFALPMIGLGYLASAYKDEEYDNRVDVINCQKKMSWIIIAIGFFLFSCVSFLEVKQILKTMGSDFSIDITIFNLFPAVFMFVGCIKFDRYRAKQELLCKSNKKPYGSITRILRKTFDYVYIIHPLVIYIITRITGKEYISRYILVLVFSILFSYIIVFIKSLQYSEIAYEKKAHM